MVDDLAPDGTWPMPPGGPCRTWPLDDACNCLPAPNSDGWTDVMADAVESATDILWHLTAGRFGICHTTVRPCRKPMWISYPPLTADATTGPSPALIDGTWWNLFCGCAGDSCGCGPTAELRLPGPVYVDALYSLDVRVDGTLLDSGAWTLFDHNRLVRVDGHTWPDCQYLDRAVDEPGTFAITYWRGQAVPAGGRRAVAALACELWKACAGDKTCRLPSRVQNITREGISYTILDPQDFLSDGRTGIVEVDMWLAAVNPKSVREPSTVWSPDLRAWRSQSTSGRRS